MFFTIFYFLVSIIFGWGILRRTTDINDIWDILLLGFTVGVAINTAINYLNYIVFGFSLAGYFLLQIALLSIGTILIASTHKTFFTFNRRKLLPLTVLICLSAVVLTNLFKSHMLNKANGDLYTGGASYGDLAFHTTLINSFVYGDNRLSQNPVFSQTPLTYAPLMDFQSSIFLFTGATIQQSLYIPGILFSTAIIGLLYLLSLEMINKIAVAAITPVLFFLNGGLGFIYFLKDWQSSGRSLMQFLPSLDKQYAHLADFNIHFSSIVSDYFLPQRTFLFGFTTGLAILILLFRFHKSSNAYFLILAGLLTGLLPIIHPHSLIAVVIFIASYLLINFKRKDVKRYLYFFVGPFLILGALPIHWIITSNQVAANFGRFQLFWMSDGQNPLVFYLNNLGLVIPLALISLFWAPKTLLRRSLPFFAIFLITNVYIFQPHDYDNMKIMIYPFFAFLVLVGFFLHFVWSKRLIFKPLVITLFFFLILTGFLSVLRESYAIYKIYDRDELEFANNVKLITTSSDIVLTSDQHNHPVTSFSARPVVMGYRGWLWTWGYDYREREKDVISIYQGSNEVPLLIKKYKITYIVIGPSEKSNFNANWQYFNNHFTSVLKSESYALYDAKTYKP